MIIDRYIPGAFKRNYETHYKARVFFSVVTLYSALLLLIELWLLFIAPASEQGKMLGTIILASMLFAYFLSVIIARFSFSLTIPAHLIIGATVISIACGIAISGGPLYAPAIAMNILPIIMAFILIGKRAGLVWTQIILTLHVSFIVASAYGIQFVQLLPSGELPSQHLAHWLITYTAMIGLMFVFDSLNTRLKAERDAERLRFEHLASHDPLTNLANRLQFDISLNKSMNRGDRHQKMTALLYIDLDGFKPINDSLGHDAGDVVLREIATRLEHNVRNMDTVARLGGDEFGIILEEISDPAKLGAIAEKLLKAVSRPIRQLASKPSVSASIGIAVYPLHTNSKEELIKYSDLAMYSAKQEKNRWIMYSDNMNENQ